MREGISASNCVSVQLHAGDEVSNLWWSAAGAAAGAGSSWCRGQLVQETVGAGDSWCREQLVQGQLVREKTGGGDMWCKGQLIQKAAGAGDRWCRRQLVQGIAGAGDN